MSSLEQILGAEPRLLVGLERVANPENVGNVFRNAVAFGADRCCFRADVRIRCIERLSGFRWVEPFEPRTSN